jgi:GNAT superfamily N-acetyltransferase
MTLIDIRDAHANDSHRLADWAVAMAWETEQKKLDPDIVRRGIRAVFDQPGRGSYYIAERNGQPAGTLMITYEWSDWRNGDWWWIQSVYVAPRFRRRGVFAALYRHVEALARTTPGVIGLRLYMERDNAAARATYTALGMHDAGYEIYEALL